MHLRFIRIRTDAGRVIDDAAQRILASLGGLIFAGIGLGDAAEFVENELAVLLHRVVQALHLDMFGSRLFGDLGGHPRGLEIFRAQVIDDGAVERAGDDGVGLATVDNRLQAIIFHLGGSRLGAGQDELAVELRQLLFTEQLAAGGDETVIGAELLRCQVGPQCLLLKLLHALLGPVAGEPRRLEFRIELIGEIGFRQTLGDFGGQNRVGPAEANTEHIAAIDAFDDEIALNVLQRVAAFRLLR